MYQRKVFNRYLTDSEESQLFRTINHFASLQAKRDYAWMMLVRQTGIRITPLASLTVGDARTALHEGHLQVRGETNKGGRDYRIYLNKTAVRMLQRLLSIRRQMGHAERPDEPLIMSRNHRGVSVRGLQSSMTHWVQTAGLTVAATPHWLRHTFAKRIIERSTSRDPLSIAQHALGHADINSTAIYTYPDRAELEAAIEAAS